MRVIKRIPPLTMCIGKKTLLLLVAVIFLSSCAKLTPPQIIPQPTYAGPFSNIKVLPEGQETSLRIDGQLEWFSGQEIADLLLNEACPTTCWMGIMPGQTSSDDAEDIIKSLYWDDDVELLPSDKEPERIFWQSIDKIHGGDIGIVDGYVYVLEIWFQPGYLTLEDLELLGTPDLVFVYQESRDCLPTWVAYPDRRITIELLPDPEFVEGVSPSQYVRGITIHSSEAGASGGPVHSTTLEWNGYQDYCELLSEK